MRIGLVGLGSIGTRHAANLLALGCEVVAMDVSSGARDAAAARLPMIQVSDSLSFTGLDALVIATPAESHLQWVEEAIRRQMPFFVEKPLGTLEQLPRWRELATMTLPVNQVGYNWLFHPDVADCTHLASYASWVHLHCHTDIRDWPGVYASPLLECSHEIAVAMAWGFVELSPLIHPLTAGGVVCQLHRPSDHASALIDLWWHAPRPWRDAVFGGDKTVTQVFNLGDGLDLSYYSEMRRFLKRVTDGARTNCPLVDGLRVLEVCAQVEQMTKAVA